jgi:hypothetical protein
VHSSRATSILTHAVVVRATAGELAGRLGVLDQGGAPDAGKKVLGEKALGEKALGGNALGEKALGE